MNNNLENTYKSLLLKYNNDLDGYKYVLPSTRYLLKPGHMIKYIKINDNSIKQKILFGFIVSVSIDEVVLKSVGVGVGAGVGVGVGVGAGAGVGATGKKGFIWKVKINNNYIFVKNPYTNKLRELLEDKFMDLLQT
jgi:hypothetical protein